MSNPDTIDGKIVFWVTCADCGREHPVGGNVNTPGSSPEGPEHHEPDCPVRAALVKVGRWEEPDA